MDWQEEPATNQQLLRLQQYGFVQTCPLTVTQAARLIRQYSKRPPPGGAIQAGPNPAPVQRSDALITVDPVGTLSEAARLHAFQLRVAVLTAEKTVREDPERPGVRADLRSCISARQQFWMDTCRDIKDLQKVSVHALEFYQYLGGRYFPPSWEEVQEVLDALDGAMPGWEKEHPELFYETLKLNFPSLMRQKRVA